MTAVTITCLLNPLNIPVRYMHARFSLDIDECVEAASAQRTICSHSAYCMNNPGGYECTCPGDTQLIDGECIQRKYACMHALQIP